MSKRENGWYWVKQEAHHNWRPDLWQDGKWRAVWSIPEDDGCHYCVGSRVPTQDLMTSLAENERRLKQARCDMDTFKVREHLELRENLLKSLVGQTT